MSCEVISNKLMKSFYELMIYLLGLNPWWIFKLVLLISDLAIVINLFGLPLGKVSM